LDAFYWTGKSSVVAATYTGIEVAMARLSAWCTFVSITALDGAMAATKQEMKRVKIYRFLAN